MTTIRPKKGPIRIPIGGGNNPQPEIHIHIHVSQPEEDPDEMARRIIKIISDYKRRHGGQDPFG